MPSQNLPKDAFPDIFPPREIRIIGAGRFGRLAAERLKNHYPKALLSITDQNRSKVEKITHELRIRGNVDDSINYLVSTPFSEEVWLIPAVPVHLAFEWVLQELNRSALAGRLPVPESAGLILPNPIRSPAGTLYASFANFICPDYCSEPEELCTHTGEPRKGELFKVFLGVRVQDFGVAVLRSWQLAPGVGGYPGRSLHDLLSTITQSPGCYLIATSCRCHGVMDGLEWKTR